MTTAVETLYTLVKSQLSGSESLTDVSTQVAAVGQMVAIPADVIAEVVERFRHELLPVDNAVVTPRLLVDWGELPRVGHQVRPEFSLICPNYQSRPEIVIHVDQDLDHDPNDKSRIPQAEESGLWTFHVPFRMTSEGMDCRPGHYLIDVDLSFRDVPPELPRFFRCRIRLNVPDAALNSGGVLEIDGDGQSMVNLQGYNLKQFSRVVLKGGQDSVINLQNDFSDEATAGSQNASDKPVATFEYQLKVNSEKQLRFPVLSAQASKRVYLDAACLTFEDGRRSLLLTRPRITFGRSRDNDVIIRFLPPGEENDRCSRNISRTHFIAEVTSEGVELKDESRSGMEVNYSVVTDREVISAIHAGDASHIDLGVTGTVSRKFEMEMLILSPDRRQSRDELEYWDEMYCEVVGGRLSRLGRQALDVGINAVRYDRVDNLPGEESYVHLLREAVLGGSPAQSAIILRESGPQPQARILHIDRTYWLEPLAGGLPVTVDGVVMQPQTLVPLTPGMELQFGSEKVRFDRPSQLYLD